MVVFFASEELGESFLIRLFGFIPLVQKQI